MDIKTRYRSPNFTTADKQILVELVKKYPFLVKKPRNVHELKLQQFQTSKMVAEYNERAKIKRNNGQLLAKLKTMKKNQEITTEFVKEEEEEHFNESSSNVAGGGDSSCRQQVSMTTGSVVENWVVDEKVVKDEEAIDLSLPRQRKVVKIEPPSDRRQMEHGTNMEILKLKKQILDSKIQYLEERLKLNKQWNQFETDMILSHNFDHDLLNPFTSFL